MYSTQFLPLLNLISVHLYFATATHWTLPPNSAFHEMAKYRIKSVVLLSYYHTTTSALPQHKNQVLHAPSAGFASKQHTTTSAPA
jgi:hypothetical protein